MTLYCMDDRVDVANRVLLAFAPGTSIRLDAHGYVIVCWTCHGGEKFERRWMTRGQDFYPVWYRHWGHGGTATTALAQLVRWIKGRPVLPLSAWRYWGSDGVALLRQQGDNGAAAIEALQAAGYPDAVPCVLCRVALGSSGFDWWSLNGVSGPCCGMRSGCRQTGKREVDRGKVA